MCEIEEHTSPCICEKKMMHHIFLSTSTVDKCKEWVNSRLEDTEENHPDDLEEWWEIGGLSICAEDINSFLKNVNWEIVCYVVNLSWINSSHQY